MEDPRDTVANEHLVAIKMEAIRDDMLLNKDEAAKTRAKIRERCGHRMECGPRAKGLCGETALHEGTHLLLAEEVPSPGFNVYFCKVHYKLHEARKARLEAKRLNGGLTIFDMTQSPLLPKSVVPVMEIPMEDIKPRKKRPMKRLRKGSRSTVKEEAKVEHKAQVYKGQQDFAQYASAVLPAKLLAEIKELEENFIDDECEEDSDYESDDSKIEDSESEGESIETDEEMSEIHE